MPGIGLTIGLDKVKEKYTPLVSVTPSVRIPVTTGQIPWGSAPQRTGQGCAGFAVMFEICDPTADAKFRVDLDSSAGHMSDKGGVYNYEPDTLMTYTNNEYDDLSGFAPTTLLAVVMDPARLAAGTASTTQFFDLPGLVTSKPNRDFSTQFVYAGYNRFGGNAKGTLSIKASGDFGTGHGCRLIIIWMAGNSNCYQAIDWTAVASAKLDSLNKASVGTSGGHALANNASLLGVIENSADEYVLGFTEPRTSQYDGNHSNLYSGGDSAYEAVVCMNTYLTGHGSYSIDIPIGMATF